jgi:DNA-directed RNA polymerase specialized sigma24 family protein
MAKKTATDRTPEEQFNDVFELLCFLTWKKLNGVSPEWVEDFIQDEALKFWGRLNGERFAPREIGSYCGEPIRTARKLGKVRNPRAYLYRFVQGECADFLDKKRDKAGFRDARRRWRSLSELAWRESDADGDDAIVTLADLLPDSDPGPAAPLESAQTRRAVRRVLNADPRGDLWRLQSQGLSYAEIARSVGLTAGQVRGRMARSKSRLRERLRKAIFRGAEK